MTSFKLLPPFIKNIRTNLWSFAKKKPKTTIGIVIALLLVCIIIFVATRPKAPEYVTEPAVRGDLTQIVEAVGEVISERDLKLQFPITGIIDRVYVEEGDEVVAGEELARLRSSGLLADVNSAAANVASARADLDKMIEGTRPEEIAIARASVENKRASLAAARQTLHTAENSLREAQAKVDSFSSETDVSLDGNIGTAESSIASHLATASIALKVLEGELNGNDLLDVLIKHEPSLYKRLQGRLQSAQNSVETAKKKHRNLSNYSDALDAVSSSIYTLSQTAEVVSDFYTSVSALPITPAYSTSDREAVKTAVATQRTNVLSAVSSLESVSKSLRDTDANFDTRQVTEQSALVVAQGARDKALRDVQTFETALTIEEANLSLKVAGSRPADIAGARARLNQAYAQLQRAQERFDDTVIRAPVDGKITQVNLKEGELLSTSFESSTAITMLGNSPYRIEMFISEIDIPKVRTGQSGGVLLDAFPDGMFDLITSELDPAATQVDGVSKYRAKLDFTTLEDQQSLKIGMTGDAEIYTDFRENVIGVPGRAVITKDDGSKAIRILGENGEVEEKAITTGMSGDGGIVEVLSGVEEGDVIIVLEKK